MHYRCLMSLCRVLQSRYLLQSFQFRLPQQWSQQMWQVPVKFINQVHWLLVQCRAIRSQHIWMIGTLDHHVLRSQIPQHRNCNLCVVLCVCANQWTNSTCNCVSGCVTIWGEGLLYSVVQTLVGPFWMSSYSWLLFVRNGCVSITNYNTLFVEFWGKHYGNCTKVASALVCILKFVNHSLGVSTCLTTR